MITLSGCKYSTTMANRLGRDGTEADRLNSLTINENEENWEHVQSEDAVAV